MHSAESFKWLNQIRFLKTSSTDFFSYLEHFSDCIDVFCDLKFRPRRTDYMFYFPSALGHGRSGHRHVQAMMMKVSSGKFGSRKNNVFSSI